MAEEEELVPGHTKSAWKPRVDADIASLELEDLATVVTAEMMMMILARDFVAQGLTGHRDRCEPVTLQQCADVAVYSGDA